jgi:hypothetical protein
MAAGESDSDEGLSWMYCLREEVRGQWECTDCLEHCIGVRLGKLFWLQEAEVGQSMVQRRSRARVSYYWRNVLNKAGSSCDE